MEGDSFSKKKYEPYKNRNVDSLTTIMHATQDPDVLGRIVATLDEILRLDPGNQEALAIIGTAAGRFSIYNDAESEDIEEIRQQSMMDSNTAKELARDRERAAFDALVRLYEDEPPMTDFERNTKPRQSPSDQE